MAAVLRPALLVRQRTMNTFPLSTYYMPISSSCSHRGDLAFLRGSYIAFVLQKNELRKEGYRVKESDSDLQKINSVFLLALHRSTW